jgi:hypothetical protein
VFGFFKMIISQNIITRFGMWPSSLRVAGTTPPFGFTRFRCKEENDSDAGFSMLA